MSEGDVTPPSGAPNGQTPWYGNFNPNSLASTLSFPANDATNASLTAGNDANEGAASNVGTPTGQSPITGEAATQDAGQGCWPIRPLVDKEVHSINECTLALESSNICVIEAYLLFSLKLPVFASVLTN